MSHIGCVSTSPALLRVITGEDAPEAFTGGDPPLPSDTRLTGTAGDLWVTGAAMLACRVERS
jgi:hypothetical protein